MNVHFLQLTLRADWNHRLSGKATSSAKGREMQLSFNRPQPVQNQKRYMYPISRGELGDEATNIQ